MAEGLTFANFEIQEDGLEAITDIGTGDGSSLGVVEQMATAFGHELTDPLTVENLGNLIGRVGQAKELQENIAGVQEVLGTDENAVTIARGWAEHSGLLVPVERSYLFDEPIEGPIDVAVMTGGTWGWMARRVDRLQELHKKFGVERALLIAGNRAMKPAESPDVEEGMLESDFMREVAMKRLIGLGILTTIVKADTGVGDDVMEIGAEGALGYRVADFSVARIAVVSNAGAWVQNVGQFRRAIRKVVRPDFDDNGDQLFAVSDGFPLGTGTEPTATHQNPFSAAGQIARNVQELARHA